MAADYRVTKNDRAAVPLADGEVEFVSVETQLHVGAPFDEPAIERTLLLSFGREAGVCARVGAWVDSVTQTRARVGRCSVGGASELTAGGVAALLTAQLVVVFIDRELSVPIDDIARCLCDLKLDHGLRFVVVSDNARQRQILEAADGFVVDANGSTLDTALDALDMFHRALSSAHRLTCADADDVLCATGGAENPAVLMDALWRREPFEVVAVSANGLTALEHAERVLVVPKVRHLQAAELRELVGWIRQKSGNPDIDVIRAAPLDIAGLDRGPSWTGFARMVVRKRQS